MGLSPSKRVSRSFTNSTDFSSACDSVFEQCLTLTQHTFPGVRSYQLSSAVDRLHHSLSSTHPLLKKWVPAPPIRSQVDDAYRSVVTLRSKNQPDKDELGLGSAEFKEFAAAVFTHAVMDSARAAVLRRVPIGFVGIAGIGFATKSGKDLVGTVIGVYLLGVTTSVYLSLLG